MEETSLSTMIIIVCIIASIVIAIKVGNVFDEKYPNLQPYKWGFFQGWVGLLTGGVLTILMLINPLLLFSDLKLSEDEGFRIFVTVFMAVYMSIMAIACLFIIKRKRWGWIVATILSLNPILWVVNGIYLKNRWKELSTSS